MRLRHAGQRKKVGERNALTSADEHAQTSKSRTWRPPLPRPAGGPDAAEAARRVARAGRAAIRRQHPSSLRARRGRSLPRCGELTFRTPTRHRAPNQEPGRILIPGDGAAGDQGAQNRPVCPAMAATRRLWPVPSQRLPGAMVSGVHAVLYPGGHIDLDPHGQNQARLAFLSVTHRYKRTHCLWLEQFQIADSARPSRSPRGLSLARRSIRSARLRSAPEMRRRA
jgi:hypothetical protein